MDTQNQLTDSEALELQALIAPSDDELAKIGNLEEVKEYLLNLKELNLCGRDDLITLPESIGKLAQLTELILAGCDKLTTLPKNITNLTQLTRLDLSFCNLDIIQKSITNLTQLKQLDLILCRNFSVLPESIYNLTQLTRLNLSECENLTTLSENISNLTQLTQLDLSYTPLTTLPENIVNLTQLSHLNLKGCKNIHILSENIGNLNNLEELTIDYLNIDKLPLSFTKLTKLKEPYLQLSLEKIHNIQSKEYKIKLLDILLYILKFREKLIVGHYSQYRSEETVAHYTRPDIAMKLLKQEKEENNEIKTNHFQLSNIAYVNDPSEGKVIFDYLNELYELKSNNITLKPVYTLFTFVGCFTFNHDKLNHFRLYGKEQGKEATGISIILNCKRYFSLSHENTLEKKDNNKKELKNKLLNNSLLPLYRCIYLNPNKKLYRNNFEKHKLEEISYIRIACRDELTFYHKKMRMYDYLEYYQSDINNIQKNIISYFENIKNSIQLLFKEINKKNEQEKEQLVETVSFLLLPLSYMIKHSSYEEEQECRIFRFISFNDPNNEIKIDIENKRMYVEYLPITDCIEKMYLSPGAEKYRNVFDFLTKKISNDIEIRKSDNPFR